MNVKSKSIIIYLGITELLVPVSFYTSRFLQLGLTATESMLSYNWYNKSHRYFNKPLRWIDGFIFSQFNFRPLKILPFDRNSVALHLGHFRHIFLESCKCFGTSRDPPIRRPGWLADVRRSQLPGQNLLNRVRRNGIDGRINCIAVLWRRTRKKMRILCGQI